MKVVIITKKTHLSALIEWIDSRRIEKCEEAS